jgi:putative DNA primase/helicase
MTQLEGLQQWVIWKYIDGRKVPFCADGTAGRVNDPSTFRSFSECRTAFCEGGYEGIGFVFTEADPFCGIDLDKCRDPETGELDEWSEKARGF